MEWRWRCSFIEFDGELEQLISSATLHYSTVIRVGKGGGISDELDDPRALLSRRLQAVAVALHVEVVGSERREVAEFFDGLCHG